MPFFLSDEFKTMLEDKIKGTGGPSDNTLGGTSLLGQTGSAQGGSSSSGGYRSGFLKDKMTEQNEKRKRERKNKKAGGASDQHMPEHSLFGKQAAKKKGGNDDGLIMEEVQDLIDDLKNDLKIRDSEYEELKANFAKLEAENLRLRDLYEKERNERLVIEGKLKKTAIHNELKDNAKEIIANTFFEQKKSKLTSLNSTLLSTVSRCQYNGIGERAIQVESSKFLCG